MTLSCVPDRVPNCYLPISYLRTYITLTKANKDFVFEFPAVVTKNLEMWGSLFNPLVLKSCLQLDPFNHSHR